MGCGSGGSSGAVTTQIMSVGAADLYLTFGAMVTFFRSRYNKHTNFAMEALEQPFNTQVAFGADAQCNLNRTGDLIYFMYAVIDIPGITAIRNKSGAIGCGQGSVNQFPYACDPCDACGDGPYGKPCGGDNAACDMTRYGELGTGCQQCADRAAEGPWCHWTNAIGQFLIKQAMIVIGGQVVDTLYADYLFMWEELSGKPGKRLTEMIGKRLTREELIEESAEARRLYVPLPFWFTQHSGNALPLVSLQFHGVQVHMCFAQLQQCIQVSGENVQVIKSCECTPITAQDLSARLDTTYVYLDIEERDRFATGSFEQLISQVQYVPITSNQQTVSLQLNFNHPIIELIWAVRRKCQEVLNNHFNYSGKWGKDPIDYVHLKLNNLPRFSGREARYFRLVHPYQHHTNIPDAFVYCFSFALHPEAPQPSGSCNFSRIDNVEMTFDMQAEMFNSNPNNFCGSNNSWNPYGARNCGEGARLSGPSDGYNGQYKIMIFGRNWNIFRFREGLGGKAFA